jgi:hypothetical protein
LGESFESIGFGIGFSETRLHFKSYKTLRNIEVCDPDETESLEFMLASQSIESAIPQVKLISHFTSKTEKFKQSDWQRILAEGFEKTEEIIKGLVLPPR